MPVWSQTYQISWSTVDAGETWDGDAVMKLFRERLLARLIEQGAGPA